jgi:hypothetical protein
MDDYRSSITQSKNDLSEPIITSSDAVGQIIKEKPSPEITQSTVKDDSIPVSDSYYSSSKINVRRYRVYKTKG